MVQPFGLTNTAATYQEAAMDRFANQFAPTINMVQIQQLPNECLHTILEEGPESKSSGSTKTITETIPIYPQFSLGFGGELFLVSLDSPLRDGETN